MIKFTLLIRRPETLTPQAFIAHWDAHARVLQSNALVRQHVRRYVRVFPSPTQLPGLPPMSFDGAAELWFDDLDAFVRLMASADYQNIIRPDEAKFIDLSRSALLIGEECVEIGGRVI